MMLQYLHEKVENPSSFLSIHFFLARFPHSGENPVACSSISARTRRDFIVQTRKADEKVFEYGLKGNTSDFYKLALAEREEFNYPPFSTLIKLTLEGKKDDVVLAMEEVQSALEPYEVDVFPAFTYNVRGNHILHGSHPPQARSVGR
jgi:hypothetical protein